VGEFKVASKPAISAATACSASYMVMTSLMFDFVEIDGFVQSETDCVLGVA
jgi:hypothetical protein